MARVLVTGSTGGPGRAAAEALRAADRDVTVHARLPAGLARRTDTTLALEGP